MAKVSPSSEFIEIEGGNDDGRRMLESHQLHHRVPNRDNFGDALVSDVQNNLLADFKQCMVNDSEIEIRRNAAVQRDNSATTNPQRHHEPRKYDHKHNLVQVAVRETKNPKVYHRKVNANASGVLPSPSVTVESGSFLIFDAVALLVIIASILATASLVLGAWCFSQDSDWNSMVNESLRNAKLRLLRDNRWLEGLHLTFLGLFLSMAVFQFFAYVTRGQENHIRQVIIFYSISGTLAAILAFFPLLSTQFQEKRYREAAKLLEKFAHEQFQIPRSQWEFDLNNATAHDAIIIAKIMRFCSLVTQDGLTTHHRQFVMFGFEYHIGDFQSLGLCTHHKFRMTCSIFTGFFAMVCCTIPCVYCFDNKSAENNERVVGLGIKQVVHDENETPRLHDHLKSIHYQDTPLYNNYADRQRTPQERDHIRKFKEFILKEDF